jgi:hypothetical protein
MKTSLTLKQRLDQDRVRKQHYRGVLRARGFIQHTIWSSPEAWATLSAMAATVGPGLILKKITGTVRGGDITRGGAGAAVRDGEELNHPAHSSDKIQGGHRP